MAKKKSKTQNNSTRPLTRKEQRKQKQVQKKELKRLYFSSKTQGKELVAAANKEQSIQKKQNKKLKQKTRGSKKSQLAPENIPIEQLLSGEVGSDEDASIDSDFSDEDVNARLSAKLVGKKSTTVNKTQPIMKKQKMLAGPRADPAEVRRRELKRQKDLEAAARKQRIKQLKEENEDDDKLISRLEKKLKLNKTKDKNRLVRKMFNDGLDYALEMCLDDDEEKAKQELKEKRKRDMQQMQDSGWSEDDDGGIDKTTGMESNEDEDSELGDDDGIESEFGDENEKDVSESEGPETDDSEEEKDSAVLESTKYKEDIYGRKRDKDGNVIKEGIPSTVSTSSDANPAQQKYVPPHQRAQLAAGQTNKDDKQSQLLERLRKQCKGLLNRLSEANLHKIANSIEQLYMKNSRFHMNTTLATLLSEALLGRALSNERMVQEHMVLLAYLHAQLGSEIGAHFLQYFFQLFDGFLPNIATLEVEDKSLNNLILALAYMYIFRIYEHNLLLQVIERLAAQLCEKSVECLLLIFQSVGFKLRKDDPLAFKQMLLNIQQQIASSPLEVKENLRLKFMLDILNAVKNNNLNKVPQFDPELAENLRKQLKAMLRNDKYVTTLNITMEDLLRADQVGKWWIVGSAWSGNMEDLGGAAKAEKEQGAPSAQRFSDKLLSLARQQKMNTAERRNIFCIIMSAEDYVDAFEKVLHLQLKDQRTIAYVIIHCCLNEQRPNPYYAHLALKFCHYNRKYQLAFQFASWDRINDIAALNKQQLKNFAHFLQLLILSGGLQLSALKVVDFLQLNKSSLLLMKDIIVGLLLGKQDLEVYQAFERVAKQDKLHQFKNSLRLFMQHFLLQQHEDVQLKLSAEQLTLLRKRAKHADNLLAYVDL